MGLRKEVCRGQEPGYQWKEFVPNWTHCLSAPPPRLTVWVADGKGGVVGLGSESQDWGSALSSPGA